MNAGVIIIILALVLFAVLAFKKISPLIIAPIVSLFVIIFSGLDIWGTMSGAYMQSTADFVKSYFLMFLVGAILGAVYEETNAARSIANKIVEVTKGKWCAALVMAITGILTYGGISGFVVYFAMFPIALHLFKANKVSRIIMPAAISSGCWTWSMIAPGAPSVQNVIAMRCLGTTGTAALIPGIVAAGLQFIMVAFWLEYRSKYLKSKGFYFEDDRLPVLEIPDRDEKNLPNPLLAAIPIIAILAGFIFFKLQVEIAVTIGIILAVILLWNQIDGTKVDSWIKILSTGASNSCTSVMLTAMVVGFGGVVKLTDGFADAVAALQNLNMPPLVLVAIATAACAGLTASATGGLGIAFDALKDTFVTLGVNLNYVHRISVIAAGTLDTLPHQGGLAILFNLCKVTHKEAYFDIFITQMMIPILTLFVVIPMCAAGM